LTIDDYKSGSSRELFLSIGNRQSSIVNQRVVAVWRSTMTGISFRHQQWSAISLLIVVFLMGTSSAPVGVVGAQAPSTIPLSAVKNREPLQPSAFYPLPLTSVKPTGWLRRQLQIQAEGLTGHLDEFWPDVGPNSGWRGGSGESWERGPYYMDGLVPLAYLLDDPQLIAKANRWIEWTLTHQGPDGAIGPANNRDWWPKMVMLKALTQYQEATGDPRVIPLMENYFHYQAANLVERPLRDWGKFRWADELVSVIWLYNRTGNSSLLDLARTLSRQGHDWKAEFAGFPFKAKTSKAQLMAKPGEDLADLALSAHGVNNAMALKTSAVWSLVSRDESDRTAASEQLHTLDQYHLLPNGMFSCDEHLAGEDPSQGSELCSVVETQFSLEEMVGILGDPRLGDRLERIAYNALPATLTADMWAHQYDQQPNQVECNLYQRDWTTNGRESNLFGLEPNFGCCTANLHQGWPKFTASLWMATPDDGLAAVAYGPSVVETALRGVHVQVEESTDYPFREEIRLTINPAQPAAFPLALRIPGWAEQASVTVNSKGVEGIHTSAFYRIERQWTKGDQVVLRFPMPVRTSRWYHNSVVVERGPLVFSLRIGTQWTKLTQGLEKPAIAPASDWEVDPTTPWNYGLRLPGGRLPPSLKVIGKPVGDFPFGVDGAPVEILTEGRRLPDWKLVDGSAGPLPVSPVSSQQPVETLSLIPYGAAKLRITAFPALGD
jgi:uncharacterized protein